MCGPDDRLSACTLKQNEHKRNPNRHHTFP